ncbi:hypothetical protein PIN31115_00238 [Pandoraea iniqua]|uniref:Uncharacterized protein n=1 Tax=Pandoraea iniqua TaxID=2508288 RepID=A0A5E4RKP1_9BURK|nr:hypothetical protein [Pandoraea iniqua]VVD63960.1 hypothetical protein PIN31115_00238 [Pandoraea iniqua]
MQSHEAIPNQLDSNFSENVITDDDLKEVPDFEVICVEGCLSSSNVLGF